MKLPEVGAVEDEACVLTNQTGTGQGQLARQGKAQDTGEANRDEAWTGSGTSISITASSTIASHCLRALVGHTPWEL